MPQIEKFGYASASTTVTSALGSSSRARSAALMPGVAAADRDETHRCRVLRLGAGGNRDRRICGLAILDVGQHHVRGLVGRDVGVEHPERRRSRRRRRSAARSTNPGTDAGAMPANVFENIRPTLIAGLAKLVELVNQYAAPMYAPTAAGAMLPRLVRASEKITSTVRAWRSPLRTGARAWPGAWSRC